MKHNKVKKKEVAKKIAKLPEVTPNDFGQLKQSSSFKANRKKAIKRRRSK